jgi:hypothetical protein
MQHNPSRSDTAFPAMRISCHSDDLLSEIQATLAALADLECSYEIDQERLKQSSSTDAAWQHLRVERERRHRQEREPYVQRLNQFHHRMQIFTSSI